MEITLTYEAVDGGLQWIIESSPWAIAYRGNGKGLGKTPVKRAVDYSEYVQLKRPGLEPVTVGRHSCSDLSIQGDPFLALRHLFVLVRPALENLEAGPLTLEFVELRTDVGMQIEGVGKAAAAIVEGAVSVGLASRRVVFLPLGGSWPKSPEVARQRFFGEPVLVVDPTHFTNPKSQGLSWSDSTSISFVRRVIDLDEVRNGEVKPQRVAPDSKEPIEAQGSEQTGVNVIRDLNDSIEETLSRIRECGQTLLRRGSEEGRCRVRILSQFMRHCLLIS